MHSFHPSTHPSKSEPHGILADVFGASSFWPTVHRPAQLLRQSHKHTPVQLLLFCVCNHIILQLSRYRLPKRNTKTMYLPTKSRSLTASMLLMLMVAKSNSVIKREKIKHTVNSRDYENRISTFLEGPSLEKESLPPPPKKSSAGSMQVSTCWHVRPNSHATEQTILLILTLCQFPWSISSLMNTSNLSSYKWKKERTCFSRTKTSACLHAWVPEILLLGMLTPLPTNYFKNKAPSGFGSILKQGWRVNVPEMLPI